MSELKIFENPAFGRVRTVDRGGEPWFVGKDVATALGYSDQAKAIRIHVDEEDKGVDEMATPGGTQSITIINESGLYSLVLSSKLPTAKAFKRWITSEVIPFIRKTGGYIAGQEELSPSELMAKALMVAQNTLAERDARIAELQAENCMKDQVIADFAPVRSYVDQILDSPGTMATTQIAADYDISAHKLNHILHEERIQRKVNGQWILYKDFMGKGYTKSKTFQFIHSDGRPDITIQTQWTQKGRLMIHDILKKRGIQPLLEREKET